MSRYILKAPEMCLQKLSNLTLSLALHAAASKVKLSTNIRKPICKRIVLNMLCYGFFLFLFFIQFTVHYFRITNRKC